MCEFVYSSVSSSPTRLELHHWASDTYYDKYKSVRLTNDTKRQEEEEEGKQRITTVVLTGDWLSSTSLLLIDFIISSPS